MKKTCIALLACLLWPGVSVGGKSKSDLIVLVLIDALRADHVTSYGYNRPTTPVIDRLAKQGVRFTRAYVNAPWTRPSTTGFLTGLHASRHRTQTGKSKLPKEVTTLAQRLKAKGYATAGFTANGNGGSLAGLQKGFDVFEDPSTTYPRKSRGKTYCCNGLPTGEFLNKHIFKWLETEKNPKKFLFVFYVDPHDPYGAPPNLEKMFLGKDFKGKIRRKALWETHNDYPPDEQHSLMALYDAGIRYADQALGGLVGELKTLGYYDDATIFVTADHGEGFGEHNFYLHAHHFWEEVIHVPLIVLGPRFSKGQVDDRMVDSTDVARTIVDLATAPKGDLKGHSLLTGQARQYVVSEYNEFGIKRQAIVGQRYKVIWQRPADEAWYMRVAKKKEYFPSVSFDKDVIHVFDLQRDPKEQQDLSGAMPKEAQAMLQTLRDFVAQSDKLAKKKDPRQP